MILEIFRKTLKIEIGGRPMRIYNENVPQNDTGHKKNKIGKRPALIYNKNAPNNKNQNRRASCAYLQPKMLPQT